MRLLSSICLLPLLASVNALHFYFESNERRCFMEELPSDTIVEADNSGHYKALLWNEANREWIIREDMGIRVNVIEMSTGHVVVDTRGPAEGRFTFTSHDPGDHDICLDSTLTGGWLSNEHIKMYLDINVGSAKHDKSEDVSHATTLATKLKELNNKVADIQREQRYMREVEATFRDASEKTNTRAVWWSVVQIGVLIGAAVWQMRYLKDKKLR